MGTEKVTVRADGFRLHPNAEIQPQIIDLAAELRYTAGQFGGVCHPVAQAGGVAVAALEPAVIQHKEVSSRLPGSFGQVRSFASSKLK